MILLAGLPDSGGVHVGKDLLRVGKEQLVKQAFILTACTTTKVSVRMV
jgi:hypothetical protein